jgi:hypothetical protein
MYKIKSLKSYLAIASGLIITLFGVFWINTLGVFEMIFGVEIANKYIYPFFGTVLEWLAFIAIFIIIGLIIMATVSYIRNHGKPDKPSDEAIAIKGLIDEIKGLRQDMKNQGGCKYIEPTKSKPPKEGER